jgi:hypothetical protein
MSETNGQVPEIDLGNLEPIQLRFRIAGRAFILREAPASEVMRWRDYAASTAKWNEDGKFAGTSGNAKGDLRLLSACLSELRDNGESKAVTMDDLVGWPSRVVEPLMERLREISALTDDNEETLIKQRDAIDRRLEKLRSGKLKPVEEQAKN